jgi:hypothetical protein
MIVFLLLSSCCAPLIPTRPRQPLQFLNSNDEKPREKPTQEGYSLRLRAFMGKTCERSGYARGIQFLRRHRRCRAPPLRQRRQDSGSPLARPRRARRRRSPTPSSARPRSVKFPIRRRLPRHCLDSRPRRAANTRAAA